eukprot:TRINITY_DN15628_c0_g1_i1.p1 TRINITY_DN15628_c0_g1~~TRINITY_DN15628_c0_g1_i1.p1  ORF type:complete len:454 (+),score=21.60 TRINITY_DN15628_c0_g1_i1:65-1426(+)
MSNTYTERKVVGASGSCEGGSILGNICGSICTSFAGICLFFGMLALLGWNEQRTVCTSRALIAAGEAYEDIKCDAPPEKYRGALVYFSCPIAESSLRTWTPADFGLAGGEEVFQRKAVKAAQKVEMFQCVEEERTERRKEGDREIEEKSYTYSMRWASDPVDSTRFKAYTVAAAKHSMRKGCGADFDGNPAFSLSSTTKTVSSLVAGSFDVTRWLSGIAVADSVQLSTGASLVLPGSTGKAVVAGNAIYSPGCEPPHAPKIGCQKITYAASSATHVSSLAQMLTDGRTRHWAAPGSWMCSSGTSSSRVDLFADEARDVMDMLDGAQSSNTITSWVLRVVGIIMTFVGIRLFFYPITAIVAAVDAGLSWFRFIPIVGWALDFLGDVLTTAVGVTINLISLGISLPCSIVVMAAMWTVMRPLLCFPLLLLSLGTLFYTYQQMQGYANETRKHKND